MFKTPLTTMMSLALAAGMGAAALPVTHASASVIFDDYASDTVGTAPSGPTRISYGATGSTPVAGARIEVVGGASTPADPFGPAGNQSLLLEDNTSTASVLASYQVAEGITQGQLRIRLHVVNTTGYTTPWVDVRFGDKEGSIGASNMDVSETAGNLIYEGSTRIYDGGNDYLGSDQAFATNTAVELLFDFDTETDTYTVKMNGTPLTAGGGTQTTFAFRSDVDEVNIVQLVSGHNSRTGSRVFIDEVQLIPEPGSLALLGLGAFAVLGRRRAVARG